MGRSTQGSEAPSKQCDILQAALSSNAHSCNLIKIIMFSFHICLRLQITGAGPTALCQHMVGKRMLWPGFLGCECTLLAHIQLFIHQCLQVSTGLLSVCSLPSLHLCLGLPQSRCRTLHLALWNFRRFAVSQPAQVPLDPSGSHPLSLEHQTHHSAWCHPHAC